VAEQMPPASPSGLQLRGAPSSSARLSKKAALVAVVVIGVILGVIVINVSKQKPTKSADDASQKKQLEPALNAGKSLTKDVPDIITEPPPPARGSAPAHASAPVRVRSTEDDARLADTTVPKFVAGESTASHAAVGGWSAERPFQSQDAVPNSATDMGGNDPAAGDALRRVSYSATSADQRAGNESDLNHQEEKLAFQQKAPHSEYLDARLTAPRSPFELKTGTVIPGILVGAMNSDLPGEIVAQVSQNVYDSASGEHVLIPQGTRLYGHYDSHVSFGQGRLLVSWQRLIFPNAYTLELGAMSGHDQEGNAGFGDQVNNHLGRVFGWALLTSVFSAGLQLSQPQQSSAFATPASGQIAAAAVGQQMAQVGAEIARRNLQIQPTLVIRKGYRFNVMVNKDIVFAGAYPP
jgi:type IV secretion system protein TrbI